MGTLFDYLTWRGDLPFERVPPNEVDSLIFSLISYLDFEGIVSDSHADSPISLQAVANTFFARHPDGKKVSLGLIIPKGIVKLFQKVKECKRFRSVGVRAYVNRIDLKEQTQFSAMTFLLGKNRTVVAYRGTDDTVIGWKENFNMSFMPVVPAQLHAAEYLNAAADHTTGKLYVTGHSKGGNLAVYAGVKCRPDVRERLVSVWSNDGPGFGKGMLSDPQYLDARHLIHTLVPKSSVIGLLLEHDESYTVVSSRQTGILQHDGLTWNVSGGNFVHLQTVSEESKRTDRTLNRWIDEMSPEQREQFAEAIYSIFSAGNTMTLTEWINFKKHPTLRDLDPQVRKTVSKTLAALLGENAKELLGEWFRKQKE